MVSLKFSGISIHHHFLTFLYDITIKKILIFTKHDYKKGKGKISSVNYHYYFMILISIKKRLNLKFVRNWV